MREIRLIETICMDCDPKKITVLEEWHQRAIIVMHLYLLLPEVTAQQMDSVLLERAPAHLLTLSYDSV